MEIRTLMTSVHIFNAVFSQVIFAFKLFSLSFVIFGSFFGIHEVTGKNFILRLLMGDMGINMTLFFSITYNKAFGVSWNFTGVKAQFRVLIRRTNFRKEEMKREILGIPSLGIRVGSFHTLERQSTPIFIDFCVRQVVSLLITFR